MNLISILRRIAAFALVGTASVSAQAPIDLRVALVIGNSAYTRAPLQNPANDAEAMAKSLKSLGFDVIELRDGSKAQMAEAIAKVRETLRGKQGVGMLYYSGHGLQLDWRNYMVPVDASLAKPADVPEQTIDVGNVIDAFKTAGNRMNILVLDACRDNPFAAGTASGKGLAQLDAPPGTLLAYSTAPGNVADDGEGTNGLYTQYLLAELDKPTAKIEDVFKRVRFHVRQKSAGRQIPWESTSLEDDFYFDDARSKAAKAERDRLASSAPAREKAFAQEKADWDRIKGSKNADDLYAFLKKYPSGSASELVQAQLERLSVAQVVAQADRFGETQNPVARRFRTGDSYDFVLREGLTGLEKRRFTARVTEADDNFASYVGAMGSDDKHTTTVAGAIINDSTGSYDPPFTLIPGGEYQVGKRWGGRSILTLRSQQKLWIEYSGRIVGREKVTVPAGTFDAYRIEFEVLAESGLRRKTTMWAQPEWGFPVKTVIEDRARSAGTPDILIRELLARRRTQ